mgnify:CR=1 FL=1
MEFIIGLALAIAVGLFATATGLDRDRSFYPTITIVIAGLYVLFAVMGESTHALMIELAIGAAFVIAAVAGFKGSLWIVVVALAGATALGAVWKIVHATAGARWYLLGGFLLGLSLLRFA